MAVTKFTSAPYTNISSWLWVEEEEVTPNPMKPHKKKIQKKTHSDTVKLQTVLSGIVVKVNAIIDELGHTHSEYALTSHTHSTYATTGHSHGAPPAGDPTGSDRRLKEDIKIIGKSPSGLNIYQFRFNDSYRYGDGLYQGVMSDEVSPSIVTQDRQGYDMVDYNQIDVDFKSVSE